MKMKVQSVAVMALLAIVVLASALPALAQQPYPPYPPAPPAPDWRTAVQQVQVIITSARNLAANWRGDLAASGWQAVGSPWWSGSYWEVMAYPIVKAATAPVIPGVLVAPNPQYGGPTFCQVYPSARECQSWNGRWY